MPHYNLLYRILFPNINNNDFTPTLANIEESDFLNLCELALNNIFQFQSGQTSTANPMSDGETINAIITQLILRLEPEYRRVENVDNDSYPEILFFYNQFLTIHYNLENHLDILTNVTHFEHIEAWLQLFYQQHPTMTPNYVPPPEPKQIVVKKTPKTVRLTRSRRDNCALCLEDLLDGRQVRAICNNSHLTHENCYMELIENNTRYCPMCRGNLRFGKFRFRSFKFGNSFYM